MPKPPAPYPTLSSQFSIRIHHLIKKLGIYQRFHYINIAGRAKLAKRISRIAP
jgi:hypothetical protein